MRDGYVLKSKNEAKISTEDLECINKLTRRKFTQEEVYTFPVILCDNDIDREHERFTDESLEKLATLYIGKTGIMDHNPTSGNQTARIYSCKTELVEGKTNRLKQPYKRLIAKAYIPKSDKNKNIILEIDSGIKKEVSVGCAVENKICSICSKNLKKEQCAHIKGHRYKSNGIYQTCHTILDNPTDAYEWSFVAVPAQREAGVIKMFNPKKNGGDKNVEEIIKNLSLGQSISFSEHEVQKLFELITSLKEKARIGDVYQKELKQEMLKLSAMVQPEISLDLMKNVAEKLSIEELKSFRDSFKTKVSNIIPPKPQFATEQLEVCGNHNIQFKI